MSPYEHVNVDVPSLDISKIYSLAPVCLPQSYMYIRSFLDLDLPQLPTVVSPDRVAQGDDPVLQCLSLHDRTRWVETERLTTYSVKVFKRVELVIVESWRGGLQLGSKPVLNVLIRSKEVQDTSQCAPKITLVGKRTTLA